MKKLIILRGLPGSGKTTLADFLVGTLDSDVSDVRAFAADDYFYTGNGEYEFDKDQIHFAHLSCQQNVEIAMIDGVKVHEDYVNGDRQYEPISIVIVHNTSTAPKELKPYMELAERYGYEVTSLIVENRHGNKSVHNVPDETLSRMRDRFEVKL